MIRITIVPVTVFGQNCRIVSCTETGDAVVVDPGGEPEKIVTAIKHLKVTCKAIWLTHSHLDHCGAVAPLLDVYKVPLVGHPDELQMRKSVSVIANMYGLPASEWPNCPEPTVFIQGGEVLEVGELRAEVRFTPGHSPGHVSFYFEKDGVVISGDALFQGSIGRTDLPGGNHNLLIQSIRQQLLPLPDSTRVLSGHGPDTTIGIERDSNPFLME